MAVVPALSWRTREEGLPRLEEAVRAPGRGAFPVNLSGAGRTRDGTVFVKVDEGTAPLAELNARLLAALGPPPGFDPPVFLPVMGIGRGATVSEAEFLQRQIAGHLSPIRFSVEHLSFVVEDGRGLWHEEARLSLVPDA